MRNTEKFDTQTRERILQSLGDRLRLKHARQEKTELVAATLFFEHGIYPSAMAVRAITEKGSLGDIQADLNRWWARIREKAHGKMELEAFPPALGERLTEMAGTLWDQAQAMAGELYETSRQAYEEKIEKNLLRIRLLEEDLANLKSEKHELIQAITDANRHTQEAHQRLAARESEVAALLEQLSDLKVRIEEEIQARQAALDQFSQDLAAEREARARDSEIMEGEIRFAKMQIDQARQTAADLRDHNDQLKKALTGNDTVIQQLNRRAREGENRILELERELNEARERETKARSERSGVPSDPQEKRDKRPRKNLKSLQNQIRRTRSSYQKTSR